MTNKRHRHPLTEKATAAILLGSAALLLTACAQLQPPKPQPDPPEVTQQPPPEPPPPEPKALFQWYGDGRNVTHIEIDVDEQKALFYDGSHQIGWTTVASGLRSNPTPTGQFAVSEKIVDKRSNLYGKIYNSKGKVVRKNAERGVHPVPAGGRFEGAKMPYFLRLTNDGIGMHAGPIPRPGRPASHGCIRLPSGMAPILYRHVSIGTPVTIVGNGPSYSSYLASQRKKVRRGAPSARPEGAEVASASPAADAPATATPAPEGASATPDTPPAVPASLAAETAAATQDAPSSAPASPEAETGNVPAASIPADGVAAAPASVAPEAGAVSAAPGMVTGDAVTPAVAADATAPEPASPAGEAPPASVTPVEPAIVPVASMSGMTGAPAANAAPNAPAQDTGTAPAERVEPAATTPGMSGAEAGSSAKASPAQPADTGSAKEG